MSRFPLPGVPTPSSGYPPPPPQSNPYLNFLTPRLWDPTSSFGFSVRPTYGRGAPLQHQFYSTLDRPQDRSVYPYYHGTRPPPAALHSTPIEYPPRPSIPSAPPVYLLLPQQRFRADRQGPAFPGLCSGSGGGGAAPGAQGGGGYSQLTPPLSDLASCWGDLLTNNFVGDARTPVAEQNPAQPDPFERLTPGEKIGIQLARYLLSLPENQMTVSGRQERIPPVVMEAVGHIMNRILKTVILGTRRTVSLRAATGGQQEGEEDEEEEDEDESHTLYAIDDMVGSCGETSLTSITAQDLKDYIKAHFGIDVEHSSGERRAQYLMKHEKNQLPISETNPSSTLGGLPASSHVGMSLKTQRNG